MTNGPFAHVGRVVKTHGLHGEVSVAPATETSLDSLVGLAVWMVPPGAVRTSRILGIRRGPKGPLFKLESVDSIEVSATLVGATLLANPAELPVEWGDVEEEETDLLDYTVFDTSHGKIGTITETIVTGANDVWVVEGRFGEVLIPVIDSVVNRIDDDTRRVDVTLLEGLLPEDRP